MTTPEQSARAFSDALVREVRAEMGRQGIRSVRALATKLGDNHVYWNDRINKTPERRVAITMGDLVRLCEVLDIEPWDLVHRAGVAGREEALKRPHPFG